MLGHCVSCPAPRFSISLRILDPFTGGGIRQQEGVTSRLLGTVVMTATCQGRRHGCVLGCAQISEGDRLHLYWAKVNSLGEGSADAKLLPWASHTCTITSKAPGLLSTSQVRLRRSRIHGAAFHCELKGVK